MFVRCMALLLLSSVGAVLGSNRCHPEHQAAACFDITDPCPWSVASESHRQTLQVCTDKPIVTGIKRCAAGQLFQCIDPTEEPCTPVEAELSQDDIDNLNLCTDLEHHYKRCHPKAANRCFHPLQQCVGEERDNVAGRCDDLQTYVGGGANRCDANQPYRCIDPTNTVLGTENAACPESVIAAENLKFCDDVNHGTKLRCHPWTRDSCFDPTESCPWTIRPVEERSTLDICPELMFDASLPRCHEQQDGACIDPDQNFLQTLDDCGYNDDQEGREAFEGLQVCTDKSHLIKRCDSLQRERCFYPTEQCVGDQRNGIDEAEASLCDDVTVDPEPKLRCDRSQQVPCIDPRQAECDDMTGLVICNDIDPTTFTVKRCDPRQVEPCLGGGQAEECTISDNPLVGQLKICDDHKTQFERCDPRQLEPCLTYEPEANLGCTFELLGDQNLSLCSDITAVTGDALEVIQKTAFASIETAEHNALCKATTADPPGANCKHPLVDVKVATDCAVKKSCEILFFAQDPNVGGTFCTDIDENSKCLGPLEDFGAGNAGNGGDCPANNDNGFESCFGYESRCALRRSDRCFEIDPEKACFENVDGLSRCSEETEKIDLGLKRCHTDQAKAAGNTGKICWDPNEPDCTATENANFAGVTVPGENNFVYLCGDKAHLEPRAHKRQKNPCLERTEENLPNYSATENANRFIVDDLKNTDTVSALCPEIARAISVSHPTCDPIQGDQACIDPSPDAVQCDPVNSSLRYCADKIVPLLGTADEVNRCHPLNIRPCIDPRSTNHCPFEYLAQQPGISVCPDFELPAKRCVAANNPWGACYFVGADGIEETCTDEENEDFATLDVCPDAAARINRCHPRQVMPCRDPTDPCSTELNPQYLTLGICPDLVSMAPSTLPSQIPSNVPSNVPSFVPSSTPSLSVAPSDKPSLSAAPSASPSDQPSASPSDSPSASPSESPSDQPSASPSDAPSAKPSTSASPSAKPSPAPSESPSGSPSSSPSASPTLSSVPSATPSFRPTVSMKPTFKGQTYEPSDTPSASPSASPSESPSSSPSASPSSSPSASPSSSPSSSPSASPSSSPSSSPSASPTLLGGPSATPSVNCVDDPDFRLDAIERRNCEWARENPDRVDIRCGKVDSVTNVAVADACPLSCNPECEEFVPTATPETPEPTVSPETQCGEDDPTPFFVTSNPQKVRNCEWVGSNNRKRETRCRKEATDGELVSTKCTFTCQLRCVCKNSKKRFGLNGERVRCADVRRNQCDQGVVKERCPKKCNFCFDLL